MKSKRHNFLYSFDVANIQEGVLKLFLALSILLFVVYPLFCILKNSVWIDGGISFKEYQHILKDNSRLVYNSLFTAVLSAAISTVWSIFLSIRVVSLTGLRKKLLILLLAMSMVSPPFIASLTYIQLYGRRGMITHDILHLSYNPYNEWGIIAMQSIHFVSLSTLFLIAYLEKMDRRLIDASRDLGASIWNTYKRVVLPMMFPAAGVAFILSFIRSISDFGTPAVIGGRYDTLASAIYMQLIGYGKMEYAAAMNMLLLIPAIISFIVYRIFMVKSGRTAEVEGFQSAGTMHMPSPGGTFGIITGLFSLIYIIMMLLQYGCIFVTGFLKSRKGVYYFSLEHFDNLFQYNIKSLSLSLEIALVVSLLGSIFGLLLSYYLVRKRMPLGGFFDFMATLPYLLPGTCFGIGYILAFNHEPLKLTGTVFIIAINMLFKQLPAVLRIGSVAILQISERIEEAARDLGARRINVVWQIVFPNLGNAFVTSFLYNFAGCMTTAGAVIFLISAKYKIAVYTLFDAINSGEYGVAALISSIIILLTLIVAGIAYGINRFLEKSISSTGGKSK